MLLRTVVFVCLFVSLCLAQPENPDDEEAAKLWLVDYNTECQLMRYDTLEASWTYNTNITDHNLEVYLEKSANLATWDEEMAIEANLWHWNDFQDELVVREFSKITDIGTAALPDQDYNEMERLQTDMTTIYNTATVCDRPGYDPGLCYPLEPDLTGIMGTSRDWDELLWAWEGWRDASGQLMPDTYESFVGYLNQAAVLNGYADNGAYWRSWYEMEGFDEECERLWNQVKPLYEQVHAYSLRKMKEFYADYADEFPSSGHIPAHIMGNMWAQEWSGVESILRPYPEKSGVDVTDELVRQGYDALAMFELSDEFFTSLGLIEMPQPFWDKSMIVHPDDGREVVCHAAALDLYNQIDFRIKQCTEVTHDWLIITHHEMGHVEYYLQYKELPVQFRGGANPGFHEAIGDVMSLSVSTPDHLQKVGLLPDWEEDEEVDLNFLMDQALRKLVFLPFAYLVDQWRWDVFAGESTRDNYNRDWWDMRCKFQGVSPPVSRHARNDFDPGAKYHIPNNTPYIRYFIAHILQYQFHEAMCQESGHTGPLHRCDIYESLEAGQMIADMMELGSSVPWQDALEAMIGTREMSAEPMVKFFQPLLDWLAVENEGHPTGWEEACPTGAIIP